MAMIMKSIDSAYQKSCKEYALADDPDKIKILLAHLETCRDDRQREAIIEQIKTVEKRISQ